MARFTAPERWPATTPTTAATWGGDSDGSTLIIEEMFNRARLAASCNRRGQLDVQGGWHTSVFGSPVLGDFGRPPTPTTLVARSAAPQRLPATLFAGDASRRTLSEEQLGDLTKARPEEPWPSLSAASLRGTALQWALAKDAGGEWVRMEHAWLSLLAIPRTLLLDTTQGRSMLVLHSSAFGYLGLRTPVGANGALGYDREEGGEVLRHLRPSVSSRRRGSTRAPTAQ